MSPAAKPADESTYSGRFAARLRMLREKTGMTGEEFAQAMVDEGYQMSRQAFYHWERGRTSPPIDAFPVIAKLLKLKSPRTLLPLE